MRTVHLSTSERAAYGTDRLRTASGREARDGEVITPDDPIVYLAAEGTGDTIDIGFVLPLPVDEDVRCEPLMGPIVDVLASHPEWEIAQAEAHLEAERLATWDRVLG